MTERPAQAARIESILRRLIAAGFPELRRLDITIEFRHFDGDDLLSYEIDADRYLIAINDCLCDAPKRVLEGGIAHELSHIVHDSRMTVFRLDLAFARYANSIAYRIRDERRTELRVIERGFGEHLLAFVRYARRLGYSFSREHGLLPGEILALVSRNSRTINRLFE